MAPDNLCWACSGLWKSLGHTLLPPSCWHLPEGLGPQGLRLRQDHPDSFPCWWPPCPAQARPPQSTLRSGQVSVLVPQRLGTMGQAGLPLCLPGAQVLNSRGRFPCQDRESFFSSGPAAPLSATLGSQEAAGEARGPKATPPAPFWSQESAPTPTLTTSPQGRGHTATAATCQAPGPV